ncbi:MAG TPA: HoxN/HupN/NixA family nickel/cobalt transporter [Ktedonobacterales bacterium]
MFANLRRVLNDDTPGLRRKVIGIYSLLIAVNLALWALTLVASIKYPLLLGFAAAAYGFGLRHAVDADHISAIDNVTRKLMQEKKKPVTVGFFFSLGHSSVVLIMTALVAAGSAYIASNIGNDNSPLKVWGSLIGTGVSAFFLFAIAVINLIILVQIFRAFRSVTRGGAYCEDDVDEYLNKRGFLARVFRPLFKSIDTSWKMYPVGFLFGLGFDTATEVGLLASAGAFATQHVPFYVVMLLPLLFMAGMSLADTTDGVMMLGAYGWAFVKPIRKLFYNMSITLISVLVALVVGALETLSIISGQLNLAGPFWDFIGNLNDHFGEVGAGIVVIFILSWAISTLFYRIKKYDDMEVIKSAASSAAGD